MRLALSIDLDRCVGCQACVSACKEQWDSGPGAARDWVRTIETGKRGRDLAVTFYPGLCMQCEEHPCTLDCPTGATHADPKTGVVVVDEEVCIGCGNCISRCPYGARHVDPVKKVVEKCNLCAPFVARGELPACVATCPAECRLFGDLDDPASEVSRAARERGARPLVAPGVEVGPKTTYAGEARRERILAAGAVRQPRESGLTRTWGVTLPLARDVVPAIGLGFVGAGLLVNLKARADRVRREEAEGRGDATATSTPTPTPTPTSTSTSTPTATSTPTSTPTPTPTPNTADVPDLETVVRGTRRPEAAAAMAPGASVTVVDAARFAGEAKGAGELLATSPGVAVTDTGGLGQLATVSIRGASAQQVAVLLDGVPLNSAAGGGVDLSSIPPQWISRIEVVRGTEGVQHGTGALGGVVNVITAPPRAGRWSAGATAGSFGTYRADGQGGIGGAGWGLLGAVAGSHSDGDFGYVTEDALGRRTAATRTHDGASSGGALLKGFALVGGGRLDAAAQLSGERRDLPGTPATPTPRDGMEETRGIASARFRREGPGGVFLTAAGSTRLEQLDLRLQDVDGGAVLRQRELAGTGSLGADWCGDHGALSLALESGAEQVVARSLGDRTRVTYAAVLSGELSAAGGRARLGPAVRLERKGGFDGASAKIGGALPLTGSLSVRASAGRTYRVPSLTELYLQQALVLPNPALRPEVGVGGDGALVLDGALGTASLGGFATVYRDLVVYQSASFRRLMPVNVDRSLVRGVEAELATVPWRRAAGLALQAAYTYTDSQVLLGKEDVLGKDLPRKPRHRLYARAAVGGPRADAHVEAQWVSRQWLGFGRTAPVGDALTFGAGGSVRLSRKGDVRLHLEVRNLLDVRTLTDGFGDPLPGRTVLVTLRAGSTPEKP